MFEKAGRAPFAINLPTDSAEEPHLKKGVEGLVSAWLLFMESSRATMGLPKWKASLDKDVRSMFLSRPW